MSAQKTSAPARTAAAAAAIVLVALAAAVAVRLAGRREAASPKAAAEKPPPQDRVVDRKERVRHEEYEAGRRVAEIRGDTFFRGPDGLNHLQGAVEAFYYGADGAVASHLTCGEIAYAPGSLRFLLRGGVRVESAGVALEGSSFEYDKPAGLFATAEGGRFTSGRFAGAAREVSYREGADEVRLGGGFWFEMAEAGESVKILSIRGESLTYSRRERRGAADGLAEIQSRGFRGNSMSVLFVGTADEAGLASAVLEGGAHVALLPVKPDEPKKSEVGANRIALAFSGRPFSVGSLEALGGVSLSSGSSSGLGMALTASSLRMTFDGGGGPPGWSASGGIAVELSGANGAGRSVEGDRADFDPATGLVRIRGRQAVARSMEDAVEAGEIIAGPGPDDLSATGGVHCELRPREGAPGPGVFTDAAVVSVRADRMTFGRGGSSARFEGQVEARSLADFIRAAEITFETAGGGMQARDGVVAGLALIGGSGGEERRFELGGRELAFRPDVKTLFLSQNAFIRLPEASLEAGAVSAVLGGEGRRVVSLAAAGGVAVAKGEYTGRAEAARYDPSTGLLVLTGGPVLTDGKGGSARGAKLTFDLADDKILLENEGPGRSTTVIKS